MAIYHCHCKIISRGQGRSAVGAAAYRSGEKLYNEYDGIEHDYTKKGGVAYSEIMLCENAPKEYQDRQTLWNAVEKIEKGSKAQLAREYEVALPVELSREEQIQLVRDFAKENFVDKGMCVDFSIHDKENGNPHAHIMLTTRPINENGEWGMKEKKDYMRDENGERVPLIDKKTGLQKVDSRNRKQWKREYVQFNDWNTKDFLYRSRESWAEKVNQELERKNVPQRVDHRSNLDKLKALGVPDLSKADEAVKEKRTLAAQEQKKAQAAEKNKGAGSRAEEAKQVFLEVAKQIPADQRQAVLERMEQYKDVPEAGRLEVFKAQAEARRVLDSALKEQTQDREHEKTKIKGRGRAD